MSAYLDASVIIPTLIDEAGSAAVDGFFATERDLVVSEFAAAEVASALSRLLRTGKLDRDTAATKLVEFDTWRARDTLDLDIQPADVRLAAIFVRSFDLMLRTPDALHAAACQRAGMRLITMDKRLGAAAMKLGVEVQVLL